MMENNETPSGDEAQDNADESHICRATAQSLRRHFTKHFENMKAEVKELKTEDLPVLVTIQVAEAVEENKADVKDVIDHVLRSPTLISQMALVMLENDEVLETFAQFAKGRFEEAVDKYISKLTDKYRATWDAQHSSPVDPGIHSRNLLKVKYDAPPEGGYDDQGQVLSDEDEKGWDLETDSDE